MNGEISGLQRVDIWHPNNIAKSQHHTEAVGGDVHGRQDRGLVPPRVEDIQSLNSGDEDRAIRHETIVAILLSAPRTVHDNPAHHSRSKLKELLDVNLTDERDRNTGVQFTTDEPIIQHVSGVASSSKLAVLLISGLNAKASNVDEGGHEVGVDDVGGKDLNEVLRHEGPDRKLGTLSSGSSGKDSQGEGARVQSCETC